MLLAFKDIGLWGGLIGGVVSIIAVILIYMTRVNIVNILDRDSLLFDNNYDLKKKAIQNSMDMVDYLASYGDKIKSNKDYITKCKEAYNELLCVANSKTLVDNFYELTLGGNEVTQTQIDNYKIDCRLELGFKQVAKKAKTAEK